MLNYILENWETIINTLKKEHSLSNASFDNWILPLQVKSVNNNVITVFTPDDQFKNYIEKKYSLPLKVVISEICGNDYDLEFVSPSSDIMPSYTSQIKKTDITSTYSFDNFVVGKNNEFAHSAALAVAETPYNSPYNPLFLYGGSGLGKTHLMYAISNYIKQNNPTINVLYVTSEKFTNDVIEAIRIGISSISSLREKYRNVDVLLLDDIQFIIGKESTQEEFFHTFNDLYNNNKTIIISSDKPPKDFELLDERYISRFSWGLIADINTPDYETRMAILRRKSEFLGLNNKINDDVLEYIAKNVTTNIRELETCLTKLKAYSKLTNENITIQLAGNALNDIIIKNNNKAISPEYIMNIVCDHYNVSKSDITSKKRTAELTTPRHIIMYLCRQLTDAPLEKIGKVLGNRDHSTVDHGIKKIESLLPIDDILFSNINTIKKKISPS